MNDSARSHQLEHSYLFPEVQQSYTHQFLDLILPAIEFLRTVSQDFHQERHPSSFPIIYTTESFSQLFLMDESKEVRYASELIL